MLLLQQKGEFHLCSLEAVVNSKGVRIYILYIFLIFFFNASTSVTAIQESV